MSVLLDHGTIVVADELFSGFNAPILFMVKPLRRVRLVQVRERDPTKLYILRHFKQKHKLTIIDKKITKITKQ